jgi:hypothetical protein
MDALTKTTKILNTYKIGGESLGILISVHIKSASEQGATSRASEQGVRKAAARSGTTSPALLEAL